MLAQTDLSKIIIMHVNPTKSRYILLLGIYLKHKDTQRLQKNKNERSAIY